MEAPDRTGGDAALLAAAVVTRGVLGAMIVCLLVVAPAGGQTP